MTRKGLSVDQVNPFDYEKLKALEQSKDLLPREPLTQESGANPKIKIISTEKDPHRIDVNIVDTDSHLSKHNSKD